MLVNCLNL